MSESMLLTVAVFVFVMMFIGLGLTVWEFRHGQPRRQDEQARQSESTAQPVRSAAAAEVATR